MPSGFFCFFRFNLRPHFFNHLFQQGFHFFAGGCVDGVDFAFALGVGGGVASLKQVVVDLIGPAGAGLAEFAFCAKNQSKQHIFFFQYQ